MTYNHITTPTRNDALRLGTLLRRYARGGVIYGMAGVKAGLRAPVARRIITPDFKFELTEPKKIFTKSGRAKPNRSRSLLSGPASAYKEGNDRFDKFIDRQLIKREAFKETVLDVFNSKSPAELRRALNLAKQNKTPYSYINEAVINGDFSKRQLSIEEMHIRNDAINTYNNLVKKMPENASQFERQNELIRELASRDLIVENPYCSSGISYADGTEFRPGNTPLEDFLIGDGAVNFSNANPYNERAIGALENLPERYWGYPDIYHG